MVNMQRWRVHHTFERPLTVVNQIHSYPASGIELRYEGAKLVGVTHTFDVPEEQDRFWAGETSRKALSLLTDILQYWWGFPIRASTSAAELLAEDHADPATTKLRGGVSAPASTAIARPIPLPTQAILQAPPSRLPVWLRLANDARQADSPAHAVRNYYMIWEDMNDRRPKRTETEPWRLKLVRDFVSHGDKLKSASLQLFLATELGEPVMRYDPTDPAHRQLVIDARERARRLIEAELEPLLCPVL
jgi:hypothetical protein